MTRKFRGSEDDHNTDRDKAVQVFLDRYQASGKKSLHEFAAHELIRLYADITKDLKPHLSANDFAAYIVVFTEGTFDLALAAADWLRRHTQ